MIIDVVGVESRQKDLDCTFTQDCRNASIAMSMGADKCVTLVSIAAQILMKNYIPLTLEHASNGANYYACYVPIS